MRIGLARVSTKEQHLDRQLYALRADGCGKIYKEKRSGRARHRPVLDQVLDELRRGDTLVVWHLDRLGRDARRLLNLYYDLKDQGIELASITQSIETDTPDGEYNFLVACADAQRESAKISRRTKDGLASARRRGVKLGRPKVMTPARLSRARKLLQTNPSVPKAARAVSVSRSTLRRALCDRKAA